ncbi:hypothetical protein HRbin36_02331 [bacterium HR36]|nr:hypothetical protein HRbin36_02331 [bacterium HR36]
MPALSLNVQRRFDPLPTHRHFGGDHDHALLACGQSGDRNVLQLPQFHAKLLLKIPRLKPSLVEEYLLGKTAQHSGHGNVHEHLGIVGEQIGRVRLPIAQPGVELTAYCGHCFTQFAPQLGIGGAQAPTG